MQLWNRAELLKKIGQAMETDYDRYTRKKGNLFPFPLVDILTEFCYSAELLEDFYSVEYLKELYQEYIRENGETVFSLEEVIGEGWLAVMLDRWEFLARGEKLKACGAGEISKFLQWLDEKEQKALPSVRIVHVEESLERWRTVAKETPPVEWFEENHYIKRIRDAWYLNPAGQWKAEISEVLGGLWMYRTDKNDRNSKMRWLKIARAAGGCSHVLNDIEDPKILAEFILEEILLKYEIPSIETENRRIGNQEILRRGATMGGHEKRSLFDEEYISDLMRFERGIFDWNHSLWVRHEEISFTVGIVLRCLDRFSEQDFNRAAEVLLKLDRIGVFVERQIRSPEAIVELCLHKRTQFLGLRSLLECAENGDSLLMDLLGNLLRDNRISRSSVGPGGNRVQSSIAGAVLGSETALFLRYLMAKSGFGSLKRQKSRYSGSLQWLVEQIGRNENLFGTVAPAVYEDLRTMGAEGSRNMAAYCVDVWFYRQQRQRDTDLFRKFQRLILDEYLRKMLSEESVWFQGETIVPEIWKDIYQDVVRNAGAGMIRRFAVPISVSGEELEEEKPKLRQKFLLVLSVLGCLLDDFREEIKIYVAENLEMVLLKENRLLDYVNMQIVKGEEPVRRCLSSIRWEDKLYTRLIKILEDAPLLDLLFYYEACECPQLKARLEKILRGMDPKDALRSFGNERAIGIIIENHLENLYPETEKTLKSYMSAMEKSGNVIHNSRYMQTSHLLYWMYYTSGRWEEIIRGNNDFFLALVHMETEEYRDYWKAKTIWEAKLSKRREYSYGGGVYLNYMILLVRMLEEAVQDGKETADLVESFEWISGIIDEEELAKWSEGEQRDYCSLVLAKRQILGEEIVGTFARYVSQFGIALKLEDVLGEKIEPRKEQEPKDIELSQLEDALRRYLALPWIWKSRVYYGAQSIKDQEWSERLLILETVVRTCRAVVKYGSQLLVLKGRRRYLPEDRVTQLFRELYNIAFPQMFDLQAADQEQSASTGNPVYENTRMGIAEVDLTLYAKGMSKSVVEALVLKARTGRKEYREHIGKNLGNNIARYPLSFVLLYGNADSKAQVFRKFVNYLVKRMEEDIAKAGFSVLEVKAFTESPLYKEELFRDLSGLDIVYQRVRNAEGNEYQIYYVYMDLAKDAEAKLRKSTSSR